MHSKIINRTNHFYIRVFVLSIYFVLAATLELKAGKIFNIQIESPTLLIDSLHSKLNSADQLPEIVFNDEAEKFILAYCLKYKMKDNLVFEGQLLEWDRSEIRKKEVIKRKGQFILITNESKKQRILPISYKKVKMRKISQYAIRSKRIKKTKKQRK